MSSNQLCGVLLLLLVVSTSAFVPSARTTFLTKLHADDNASAESGDQPLSFDDAVAKLKDEEDTAKAEAAPFSFVMAFVGDQLSPGWRVAPPDW